MTLEQIKRAPVGTYFAFIYRDISKTHNVSIMRKTRPELTPSNKLTYDGISLQSSFDCLNISYDKGIEIPVTRDSAESYHTDAKSFRIVKLTFIRYMLRLDWSKLEIEL